MHQVCKYTNIPWHPLTYSQTSHAWRMTTIWLTEMAKAKLSNGPLCVYSIYWTQGPHRGCDCFPYLYKCTTVLEWYISTSCLYKTEVLLHLNEIMNRHGWTIHTFLFAWDCNFQGTWTKGTLGHCHISYSWVLVSALHFWKYKQK